MTERVIIIPAYNPSLTLLNLIREIRSLCDNTILVVNDGSAECCRHIFNNISEMDDVLLIEHDQNKGKGQAIKTGFSYLLESGFEFKGVLTADADGQHLPSDIAKVLELSATIIYDRALILGARSFDSNVPFRSKFGNIITGAFFNLLCGSKLTDTQTGLRYLPLDFVKKSLEIKVSGYEFETEMLLLAIRTRFRIEEINIQTVYIDNNQSSHFNPIFDSLKIYWTFVRFAGVSVSSAILDYFIFFLVLNYTSSVVSSFVIARLISASYNYIMSKNLVFKSNVEYKFSLSKYVLLASLILFASFNLTEVIVLFGIGTMYAKFIAESSLFLISFLAQRYLVFRRLNIKFFQ